MLDFVLDFLFPPVCGICGKLDSNWICEKCKRRLKKYEKFELVKGKRKINKLFNFKENKEFIILDQIYFDDFLYCYEYKNLIRKLILKYKFSDCAYLSNMFGNVILNNKKINEIFEKYDIIIPVPMDKIKKSQRGYNQTELITKYIEKNIKLKNDYKFEDDNVKFSYYEKEKCKLTNADKCLVKNKSTKTQSTLSAEKRKENIKNAFLVKNKNVIENKNIILFDDIATTGSTINEISKILKNAGASKILVLVIAKD